MKTKTPQTIYRKNYTPYPFAVETVELTFDIEDGYTVVTAKTHFKRLDAKAQEVFLDGENLELLGVRVNGMEAKDYRVTDASLCIPVSSDKFALEIQTKIYPEKNTLLEGLYKSGGTYCTQCEAQGFRHITFFPDRPDVLSVYTVRVNGDYPVLLSNGNLVEKGDGFAVWHDPFPKPCYLFALVAGDLKHVHDTYTTKSGREVDLYIYVRDGDESQCGHAMESLKKSMKWDEDVYGLEYELDIFNIVAVSDFNMGAMENTSLNIFNTALVLAHQETATDQDFINVESVIAHEYFHNWSGNRVTCRDWFQLSLKEGLTVFRDQEFSSDLNDRDVQRIDDVTHLRRFQFAEDASPLAHPIRPDEYIEINNFYTMTVYEKGAEVIRMMRTILGAENYRKGTDLYFSRHDGQAVTCEDFVVCMEEASGIDLSQFRLWYSQAGTPKVFASGKYNESADSYTLNLKQNIPSTPGQKNKKPMHIPVRVRVGGEEQVLALKEQEQEFVFENVGARPIPSLLRGFSAPVKLDYAYSDADLLHLAARDDDSFNRWEAMQTLGSRAVLDGKPEAFLEAFSAVLGDTDLSNALKARMLLPPDVNTLVQQAELADPVAIHTARHDLLKSLKRSYKGDLEKVYKSLSDDGAFSIAPEAMGRRALRNVCLAIQTCTYGTGCAKRAKEHYENANTMTDRIAALTALAPNKNPERDEVYADFYERFKGYPLVIDKWFALQASAPVKDIIEKLKQLKQHSDFTMKNPNRVRSLYSAFAMNNPFGFHQEDGSGYAFLADGVIELNMLNPQIGARLLTPMRNWKQFSADRQEKMREELKRILAEPDLKPAIYEIAEKSLNA